MKEELLEDIDIDCSDLYGTNLFDLADNISRLVNEKIGVQQSSLGEIPFTMLEKLVFLHTADKFWKSHLEQQAELSLNVSLTNFSVKETISDLQMRSFNDYESFKNNTIDAFLTRLLTFPIANTNSTKIDKIPISKDILSIIV